MRTYEFMYIVSPEVEEENLETLTARVEQMITDGGGEILRRQSWGRRRLAYPIRNFREGHYILLYLDLEPAAILELRARLALAEEGIRYLLVRTDELPAAVAPSEPPSVEEAEETLEEETDDEDEEDEDTGQEEEGE